MIAVSSDTGDDQPVRDMMLAGTDGPGGVDILINAAARPNIGAVAGIDALDDSEFSGQINVKVPGTGTTRRATAAHPGADHVSPIGQWAEDNHQAAADGHDKE